MGRQSGSSYLDNLEQQSASVVAREEETAASEGMLNVPLKAKGGRQAVGIESSTRASVAVAEKEEKEKEEEENKEVLATTERPAKDASMVAAVAGIDLE